jgi:hypothetical protein
VGLPIYSLRMRVTQLLPPGTEFVRISETSSFPNLATNPTDNLGVNFPPAMQTSLVKGLLKTFPYKVIKNVKFVSIEGWCLLGCYVVWLL